MNLDWRQLLSYMLMQHVMPNILHWIQFMEKANSVIAGKLFSSYRTVFEQTQGLRDSKARDLNCSYKAFVQKEVLTICQDRVFASFLYVLSLSSVLGRLIHLCCATGSLGRSTHAWEVNPPLLSRILNIFAVNVLWKAGEKSSVL